jgi:hypothetical protein
MSSMVSTAVRAAIFLVYTIGSSKETRVVRRKIGFRSFGYLYR